VVEVVVRVVRAVVEVARTRREVVARCGSRPVLVLVVVAFLAKSELRGVFTIIFM
jgi:hypothetical protein